MTALFRLYALSVTLILISGCGPVQGIPTAAGAVLASGHAGSWMKPQAKNHDLLYYSGENSSGGETQILSWPQGVLVGSFNGGGALCTDRGGNVWIAGYPDGLHDQLVEFSHGGESPIKTLSVPNGRPISCAVDPTTGNLAAVFGNNEVDIFSEGTSPQVLGMNSNFGAASCTYDSSGSLFVIGDVVKGLRSPIEVAELSKGTKRFHRLWGYKNPTGFTSGIRWDGTYITIGYGAVAPAAISRFTIRGMHLKPRGGLSFKGIRYIGSYAISGSKVAVVNSGCIGPCSPMNLYNYPEGGRPVKEIREASLGSASVAVSVAP